MIGHFSTYLLLIHLEVLNKWSVYDLRASNVHFYALILDAIYVFDFR